ncbi:MAG TPA: DUF883 family protein [Burkholderiales bacterium]|nr:DUF883 family protein [Burkholderiales bacterium]
MNAPTEKIVSDARILVTDVEELLKATATQTGEKVASARARVQAGLVEARDTVVLQTRHAAQATDRYVHENPWQAAGISAGVSVGIGLLIGLLLGRR